MRITLLQQDTAWASPKANRALAEEAILKAPKSDLYILPEMWSTGFASQPEGIAEREGLSLQWMRQMSCRMDAAITGSIAIEEEGQYYNRMYFVTPDCNGGTGDVASYDKRHLFTYGNEHLHYTAGKNRVVVEWRGMRFLLQICYDLRFPVFARNHEDYDAIIYVASWPATRRAPWDTLLKARAIENQCYVCAVNRVGEDPACQYNGGTQAIDPYGKIIAACPDNEMSSLTIEADMGRLDAFRKKFPVLKDRD